MTSHGCRLGPSRTGVAVSASRAVGVVDGARDGVANSPPLAGGGVARAGVEGREGSSVVAAPVPGSAVDGSHTATGPTRVAWDTAANPNWEGVQAQ